MVVVVGAAVVEVVLTAEPGTPPPPEQAAASRAAATKAASRRNEPPESEARLPATPEKAGNRTEGVARPKGTQDPSDDWMGCERTIREGSGRVKVVLGPSLRSALAEDSRCPGGPDRVRCGGCSTVDRDASGTLVKGDTAYSVDGRLDRIRCQLNPVPMAEPAVSTR